jgi:hypothetical protein
MGIGLGVTAVAFAVWVGAHHVRQQPPPPLFTEANLPPPPPSAENGWMMVSESRAVHEAPAFPSELVRLLDRARDEGPLLDQARAKREALAAFVGSREAKDALSVLEKGIAMPRFADGCPLRPGPACLVMPLLKVHRVAALEALRRGVDGDWPGALSLSARLTRADVDAATSSRMLLSHLIAIADLRLGLDVSAALLEGYIQARGKGAAPLDSATTEAVRGADAALGAMDPGALSARRAVTAEYVKTRALIEEAETTYLPALPLWSALLLDKAATIEGLNDRFSELAVRMATPSASPSGAAAPPEADPEPWPEGTFWWTYNAAGKQMLSLMSLQWDPQLRKLEVERARIEAARMRVREAARTVMQGS